MENIIPVYPQNSEVKFNTRLTSADDGDLHAHEFVEIFYVSSGNISHVIENQTYDLSVGDLVVVFPNTPHCFLRKSSCTHRDFIINQTLARQTFDFIDESAYETLATKKFVQCKITTDDIMFIESSAKRFFEELDVIKRRNYEKVIVSTLLGLIYLYANKTLKLDDFRSNCEIVISNAFAKKNAVEIIRNELGYNKYYLCRKFKETFGETLVDYVNKIKLSHAEYLLKTTNYNILEISEQIGIESLPYFIKLFTQKYGLTPAKYRKSVQLNILENPQ